MRGTQLSEIEVLLRGLPGVRDARALSPEVRARALALEEEYEHSCVLPVRNIGVREVVGRQETFVILKDSTFRQPGTPTVYMVEEHDGLPEGPLTLTVAGRPYRVIGEEVLPQRPVPTETHIPLSEGFVLYPDRRSGGSVPCTFILPPLGFPELEHHAGALGIGDIVSVSPCVSVDEYVRGSLGFSPTNELATVLIGFNGA
jgi:hypothetical protein